MRVSLLVLAGSALGGLARFWFGIWSVTVLGSDFPWGTLAINVIGSFIIGLAATTLQSSETRVLIMVGFCGGFTTFSSYSLQSLELLQSHRWAAAAAYMAGSVALCLAGTLIGAALGRTI